MEIDREHSRGGGGVLHHTHTPPHTHHLGWTGIVDTVSLPPPPGALPLNQHNSLAGDPNGCPPLGNFETQSATGQRSMVTMAVVMAGQLAGSRLLLEQVTTMMVCHLTLQPAAGTADLGAVTATAHPLVPMATTTTTTTPTTAGQPRQQQQLPAVRVGVKPLLQLLQQAQVDQLLSDQVSPAPGSGGHLILLRSGHCPMHPGSLPQLLLSMAMLTTLSALFQCVMKLLPMVMIMLTRVEHPESGDHYSLPRQPSQHSDDGRPPPLIILINPNQNYHQQPQPDQKTFPSHSGPTQHELLTQVVNTSLSQSDLYILEAKAIFFPIQNVQIFFVEKLYCAESGRGEVMSSLGCKSC